MEINHEKSKTMVNSMNNQKANIYQEGISFENVETFKKVDGQSDIELCIRITTANSATLQHFLSFDKTKYYIEQQKHWL